MSETVQLTLPMPKHLAQLHFPKSLDERLHHLIDQQNRKGVLSPAERDEAEGLAEMASLLTMLRLGAEVRALNA
jgi:hypothetical protein